MAVTSKEDDDQARAVQIVSIGTSADAYAFTYHDDALNGVLSKIPPGWKVSVVSVVGAFRTGKSFLLSWFLRYLHERQESEKEANNEPELVEEGEKGGATADGGDKKKGEEKKWYENFQSLGNDGFDWRGGAERNTTGIWMWSHPYFLSRKNAEGKKENIAVVLVDTQGMFDHETTMGLTAAIFGLSTLLSSYQIYNVDKRIQEDNLQQLALFSEYGRMALQSDGKHEEEKKEDKKEVVAADGKGKVEKKDTKDGEGEGKEKDAKKETKEKKELTKKVKKPFQRIEFLVRDWQNFEDDDDIKQMESEMEEYLAQVIAERDAQDLKDTRDQITNCFDSVTCYMFSHPGFAVTKKKYNGDVSVIDPTFLMLLNRYCTRVFTGSNLDPKIIHGRELTAAELGAYIKAYAKMFESGAQFPAAATMLEATASANNTNASTLAVQKYKEAMDRVAGPHQSDYMKPEELEAFHREMVVKAFGEFDSIANFGPQRGIDASREKTRTLILENHEVYMKLNDSRNPLAGFETYLVPMAIAAVAFILRWIADSTCSSWSQTCRAGSDVLSQVYTVVFIFLAIVASTKAKQIAEMGKRFKAAFIAVQGGSVSQGGKKKTE